MPTIIPWGSTAGEVPPARCPALGRCGGGPAAAAADACRAGAGAGGFRAGRAQVENPWGKKGEENVVYP